MALVLHLKGVEYLPLLVRCEERGPVRDGAEVLVWTGEAWNAKSCVAGAHSTVPGPLFGLSTG